MPYPSPLSVHLGRACSESRPRSDLCPASACRGARLPPGDPPRRLLTEGRAAVAPRSRGFLVEKRELTPGIAAAYSARPRRHTPEILGSWSGCLVPWSGGSAGAFAVPRWGARPDGAYQGALPRDWHSQDFLNQGRLISCAADKLGGGCERFAQQLAQKRPSNPGHCPRPGPCSETVPPLSSMTINQFLAPSELGPTQSNLKIGTLALEKRVLALSLHTVALRIAVGVGRGGVGAFKKCRGAWVRR
jgi:hypothetical protein